MKTLFQHFKTATSYLVTVDSRILNFSNTFLGPLNITHFFREKKIDISNISAGRAKLLHPWTSSSRSLELTFQHFGQILKFERFIRFFGEKSHHKVFLVFRQMFS